MNIIQLAKRSNKSPDEIKDQIKEKFNRIILSDYTELKEEIVEHFADFQMSYYGDNETEKFFLKESFQNFPSNTKSVRKDEKTGKQEQIHLSDSSLDYTKKLIAHCAENKFLIFVDTCSVLHAGFYEFFEIARPFLEYYSAKVIIPYVVLEELRNMVFKQKKERKVLLEAEQAIKFIYLENEKGFIVIPGNEDDKRTNERGEKTIHADRVIMEKLMFFRDNSRSSLFITQDHDVTLDALHINYLRSSKSNAVVLVKKIGKGGVLIDNADDVVNPEILFDK